MSQSHVRDHEGQTNPIARTEMYELQLGERLKGDSLHGHTLNSSKNEVESFFNCSPYYRT